MTYRQFLEVLRRALELEDTLYETKDQFRFLVRKNATAEELDAAQAVENSANLAFDQKIDP